MSVSEASISCGLFVLGAALLVASVAQVFGLWPAIGAAGFCIMWLATVGT